jgi:hypothetical protein
LGVFSGNFYLTADDDRIGAGMRFNEGEPEESKEISKILYALPAIAALSIIFLILIILIFMAADVEERCRYPARISLESAGNYEGWFNMSVAKTCILEEDNTDTLSLSNIGLYVLWEWESVPFLENGVETTWITLSVAKENGLNPSYEGAIIYLDRDGDGLVSKGDSLLVKSFASGGPLREGGNIFFETDDGHLGAGVYECCQ